MGNYILCRRPLSDVPFHIESVHLNIYSLEELCYFLSNNLALADEVVSDPMLTLWLSEKCGMKERIREYEAQGNGPDKTFSRLLWIFGRSHYFSESQLRQLKLQMEALAELQPAAREKARGDALIRHGKYNRSIRCYEQISRMEDYAETDGAFRAGVSYQMGCAYARLFQAGRAAECFKKAYEADSSAAMLEAYLKAVYLEGGSEKMDREAKKMKLPPERLTAIHDSIRETRGKSLPPDPEKALNEWIRAYHDSVDQ